MKKLTHTDLVNACIEVLEANNHYCIKNNTGLMSSEDKNGKKRFIRFGKKGSSDIISCSPKGKFCSWEIKIGEDTQSKKQIEYEIEMIKHNSPYHVIRVIDDLIDGLQRWRY